MITFESAIQASAMDRARQVCETLSADGWSLVRNGPVPDGEGPLHTMAQAFRDAYTEGYEDGRL